jgi:hypothetical protein
MMPQAAVSTVFGGELPVQVCTRERGFRVFWGFCFSQLPVQVCTMEGGREVYRGMVKLTQWLPVVLTHCNMVPRMRSCTSCTLCAQMTAGRVPLHPRAALRARRA